MNLRPALRSAFGYAFALTLGSGLTCLPLTAAATPTTAAPNWKAVELSDGNLSSVSAHFSNPDAFDRSSNNRFVRRDDAALQRAVEQQMKWNDRQTAETAAQATVRTTQAMATLTQILPLGVVFTPTLGLPLVPSLPSKRDSHSSH